MKHILKTILNRIYRPLLFILGGALFGLGYYYLLGCSTGRCMIASSPASAMILMGFLGLLVEELHRKGREDTCNT